MSDVNYCAFIFARGGSKGIKDKNIQPAGGKPLIAHAIECGLNSSYIDTVVVSTDSEAIAEVSKAHGAEVLERPAKLASDASPELLSWQHAINSFADRVHDEGSPFISLPATSPLRAPSDVDAAIERFQTNDCDIVFGISPSHRNPYLNMVTIDENDLIKVILDDERSTRRQDVPDCFDITTCLYVASPTYVMNTTRPVDGRVGYVVIPPERALDIDSTFDLYLADLMLSHPFERVE